MERREDFLSTQATYSISLLLNRLQDPFELFPLQSVVRSLSSAARRTEETLHARTQPYGISRKFWDVPMEMFHEEIGLFIGSVFVLSQVALTQTVGIVTHLASLAGPEAGIPCGRREILELEATKDPKTQRNYLVVIDTAADFFKNPSERSTEWSLSIQEEFSGRTSSEVSVQPEVSDNMYIALERMNTRLENMEEIVNTIQKWRTDLARSFSQKLEIPIELE